MIAKALQLCLPVGALLITLLAWLPARAQPVPSAQEIVRRADEARFPREGFEVLVNIRTLGNGRVSEERLFKVLSKGNDNTIVMTLQPASERGQILLMKGRDLWMFLPRVSQPVRLSLAQRLIGQVSNGDIARANFAGDYNARLLGTEKLGNDTAYLLELTAVDRSVTYQRVRYWVSQASSRPLKAEFYSLSDRLLKTCDYRDYGQLGGKVRPTRLFMTDALNKGEQSVLNYSAMKARDLPDQIFTKEYLRRLE
jgi:outer membrane lipoprotein-sorting protein